MPRVTGGFCVLQLMNLIVYFMLKVILESIPEFAKILDDMQ